MMNQNPNQQSQLLSWKNVLIVLLLLALMGLGAIVFLNNRQSISPSQYKALEDTIHSYRDKEGHHVAVIQSLEFDNAKQLLRLGAKDSTIRWLQQTIKDFKGEVRAAIVLGISSSSHGSSSTTVLPGDTVRVGDTLKLYPHYETNWSNKWEFGHIKATKDSIFRNIKIVNELEITTGYEKNRWIFFNSPDLSVKVKNLNPNTVTQELRSFNVKNETSRFSLGASGGVMWIPGYNPKPYIGIGINYDIIRFKKWRKR